MTLSWLLFPFSAVLWILHVLLCSVLCAGSGLGLASHRGSNGHSGSGTLILTIVFYGSSSRKEKEVLFVCFQKDYPPSETQHTCTSWILLSWNGLWTSPVAEGQPKASGWPLLEMRLGSAPLRLKKGRTSALREFGSKWRANGCHRSSETSTQGRTPRWTQARGWRVLPSFFFCHMFHPLYELNRSFLKFCVFLKMHIKWTITTICQCTVQWCTFTLLCYHDHPPS